jgi:hypothetical protein
MRKHIELVQMELVQHAQRPCSPSVPAYAAQKRKRTRMCMWDVDEACGMGDEACGMGARSCTNLDHKQQQLVKFRISQRFMHADAREQGVK